MAAESESRYKPWLAKYEALLGGPDGILGRFLAELDTKMAEGEREYGDGSFSDRLANTLEEVQRETLDLAGWGIMAFARMQVLLQRLEVWESRDFPGEFVFVSGPLTLGLTATREEVEANRLQAQAAGVALLKKGHWPFIPHTMFPPGWEHYPGLSYEAIIQCCLAWVTCCTSFLTLGGGPGADRELARAERLGLKVYHSVEEVPTVPLWDGTWEGVVEHAEAKDGGPPAGGTA